MERKTATELLEDLGWTQKDPRSAYDTAVFRVLEALDREIAAARVEIDQLREEIASALVSGTTLG